MKERCCNSEPNCTKSAEAFRDPAQPYSESKYKAYCPAHGGDERARLEIRRKRFENFRPKRKTTRPGQARKAPR